MQYVKTIVDHLQGKPPQSVDQITEETGIFIRENPELFEKLKLATHLEYDSVADSFAYQVLCIYRS